MCSHILLRLKREMSIFSSVLGLNGSKIPKGFGPWGGDSPYALLRNPLGRLATVLLFNNEACNAERFSISGNKLR